MSNNVFTQVPIVMQIKLMIVMIILNFTCCKQVYWNNDGDGVGRGGGGCGEYVHKLFSRMDFFFNCSLYRNKRFCNLPLQVSLSLYGNQKIVNSPTTLASS